MNDEKQKTEVLGVEKIFKAIAGLPIVILNNLACFKAEPQSLIDKFDASCTFENILVKGRYLKLSREVS